MSTFALIVPAAGMSTRFGGPRSKLLEPLAGLTVIMRALQPFLEQIDLAQVVIATSMIEEITDALGNLHIDPRIIFCEGGPSRADSVRLAVERSSSEIEWVAVHDAARPLITTRLVDATLAAALRYGAAVPALPAGLTIKQADGPLPARVQRTLPRHTLWTMQTPQIMRRRDLLDAFATCPLPLEQITDDAQLLELAGREVWLIPGDEHNIKITTAADIHLAELYLKNLTQ